MLVLAKHGSRVSGPINAVVFILMLAIVVSVAGCGTSDSTAGSEGSDGSGVSATTAGTPAVDNAGTGAIESAHNGSAWALGTETSPVMEQYVMKEPDLSGRMGLVKTPFDLCNQIDESIEPRLFIRNGVQGIYFRVMINGHFENDPAAQALPDDPYGYEKMATLVCSTGRESIPPQGSGPGAAGVSVACPAEYPHADPTTGGAAFEYTKWGVTAWGNLLRSVSEVEGSNGSANDGLWNYKFQNHDATGEMIPRTWLLCT